MPEAERGRYADACVSGFLSGLSVGDREARTDYQRGELIDRISRGNGRSR
jgi:hypothetical protein